MSFKERVNKALQTLIQDVKDNPELFRSEDYAQSFVTNRLFYETCTKPDRNGGFTYFSTKAQHREIEGVIYLSFRRLAVDMLDESMYAFSTTYLGGWDHYEALLKAKHPIIKNMIEATKKEIGLALYSLGCEGVVRGVEEGNMQACRFVLDRKTAIKKNGRPTKEQADLRKAQDDMLQDAFDDIDEDKIKDSLDRAGLN